MRACILVAILGLSPSAVAEPCDGRSMYFDMLVGGGVDVAGPAGALELASVAAGIHLIRCNDGAGDLALRVGAVGEAIHWHGGLEPSLGLGGELEPSWRIAGTDLWFGPRAALERTIIHSGVLGTVGVRLHYGAAEVGLDVAQHFAHESDSAIILTTGANLHPSPKATLIAVGGIAVATFVVLLIAAAAGGE